MDGVYALQTLGKAKERNTVICAFKRLGAYFTYGERGQIENCMAIGLLMQGRSLVKACGVIRHFIPASRFSIHSSVYEKNEDEGVDLTRTPEYVTATTAQKWWAPHPKTGVFGPADEQDWAGGDPCHSQGNNAESSLEQQVWFRPLEDVQRQPSN